MRLAIFCLLDFLISIACAAQQSNYKAYTVNDGLPSNNVYRCIEDDKGFLWVATDAGIARFDGKHFQIFTTKNGLPDNEVLAVVKEKNGRIWVNCFKQKPAYFDEIQNRFINAKEDSSLAKIPEGTGIMFFFPLQNGGMMFFNEKGSFIYRDGNLASFLQRKSSNRFLINETREGFRLQYGNSYTTKDGKVKDFISKIYNAKSDTDVDSVVIRINSPSEYLVPSLNDGKFYLFKGTSGQCFIFSNLMDRHLRFNYDSVKIPEPFSNFEFTPYSFYMLGISGKVYLFDKKTLHKEAVLSGSFLPNSVYKDVRGNIWLSTIDKGLLVYKRKQFNVVEMPSGFNNNNFLSIAIKQNGTIMAGNFYGEVIETGKRKVVVKSIPKSGIVSRQRKILVSQHKIFTFSENGIYRNYVKHIKTYGKTAINFNDSIIIVGQSYGLSKLNTITERLTGLKGLGKRVTALSAGVDGTFYFGSTDGLYKFKYDENRTIPLTQNNPLLQERVTSLCNTPDQLLWVATAGSGLLVVKDDNVLLHITEKEGIINNATRSISAGKPGQVWLGTSGGISVIHYISKDGKINYSIQNLSVNDGLTSNVINEMIYQNDTVYAATANGITVIPASISIPKFNIPVQLIHISINQRDTILSASYKLSFDQHNIQMEFAGIELGGHFRNLQYSLDKNANWIDLGENILTVDLNSGSHNVLVRAVDVNGNASNKILSIKFYIDTPFWKTIWFWLIIAFVMQLSIIVIVNRWLKKRREEKLKKEITGVQIAALEQQAFTSLMNPHFIFNALNSIQHYINVQDRQNANRYLSDFASLIRKNFEASQQSFIPLEQEIENIKIYLRLELMRFSNRFVYQIIIDEHLDIEDWMIPTMILQPLLENALLHGIMPSSIDGNLLIDIKEQDHCVMIVITDNGIGIINSLALKVTGNKHKSRGMELIEKRIAALSCFGSTPITISISPAFESEKNPGNKIVLLIPQNLHQAWLHAQQPK